MLTPLPTLGSPPHRRLRSALNPTLIAAAGGHLEGDTMGMGIIGYTENDKKRSVLIRFRTNSLIYYIRLCRSRGVACCDNRSITDLLRLPELVARGGRGWTGLRI